MSPHFGLSSLGQLGFFCSPLDVFLSSKCFIFYILTQHWNFFNIDGQEMSNENFMMEELPTFQSLNRVITDSFMKTVKFYIKKAKKKLFLVFIDFWRPLPDLRIWKHYLFYVGSIALVIRKLLAIIDEFERGTRMTMNFYLQSVLNGASIRIPKEEFHVSFDLNRSYLFLYSERRGY